MLTMIPKHAGFSASSTGWHLFRNLGSGGKEMGRELKRDSAIQNIFPTPRTSILESPKTRRARTHRNS